MLTFILNSFPLLFLPLAQSSSSQLDQYFLTYLLYFPIAYRFKMLTQRTQLTRYFEELK
jgi:hypothetical protein